MTAVDVVWAGLDGSEARGFWDQGFLERIFDGTLWQPRRPYTFTHRAGFDALPADSRGAVVVVAARWHVTAVGDLNERLASLHWVILVLTGDEEGTFPWRDVKHPNMRVWVQTPDPTQHRDVDRVIGDFWPPACPQLLAAFEHDAETRPLDWFFAGQVVDHPRRREALHAMAKVPQRGEAIATEGFGQGFDYPDYLRRLASAKIAPCPAGPFTPDTFRLFEALEAGCLPVADCCSANRPDVDDYWRFLFGEVPPFPQLADWADFHDALAEALAAWPANANRAVAWWVDHKRRVANWMHDDIEDISFLPRPQEVVADELTVLIPTSPIPSHPSTATIELTVESIRERPELARAEIVVMADGVRPEQEHRRADYEQYLRRLLWLAQREWSNVRVVIHDEHLHQAEMTRRALDDVATDYLLFVEHDTPLVGDIDFDSVLDAMGGLDLVRFYHEASVHPEHAHLMEAPTEVLGCRVVPTVQWSQRPHVASVTFYQELLRQYFARAARTMIEDVMHGVAQSATPGVFRLALYAPTDDDMRRSGHSDGRAGESKYVMRFAYPGDQPPGAPRAGVR